MARQHLTHCAYCHQPQTGDNAVCPACGMPVPLQRHRKILGVEVTFTKFVITLAVFCLSMALILPRG